MKKLTQVILVLIIVFSTFSVYASNDISLDEEVENYIVEGNIRNFVINAPVTGTLIVSKDANIDNIVINSDVNSIAISGNVGNINKVNDDIKVKLITVAEDVEINYICNATNVIYQDTAYVENNVIWGIILVMILFIIIIVAFML